MKTDSGLFPSWHHNLLDALHRYLLVKSISLFDLYYVMMALLHIRFTRRFQRDSDHSNLAQISTLVRLRVYFHMPAFRIELN